MAILRIGFIRRQTPRAIGGIWCDMPQGRGVGDLRCKRALAGIAIRGPSRRTSIPVRLLREAGVSSRAIPASGAGRVATDEIYGR